MAIKCKDWCCPITNKKVLWHQRTQHKSQNMFPIGFSINSISVFIKKKVMLSIQHLKQSPIIMLTKNCRLKLLIKHNLQLLLSLIVVVIAQNWKRKVKIYRKKYHGQAVWWPSPYKSRQISVRNHNRKVCIRKKRDLKKRIYWSIKIKYLLVNKWEDN